MSSVPSFKYTVPTLNHKKLAPYIDFVVVNNKAVTYEPFYVDRPFTFVTSDSAATMLYKWNGGGWTTIAGINNPDIFYARGFYSVSTIQACYVAITEHVD